MNTPLIMKLSQIIYKCITISMKRLNDLEDSHEDLVVITIYFFFF